MSLTSVKCCYGEFLPFHSGDVSWGCFVCVCDGCSHYQSLQSCFSQISINVTRMLPLTLHTHTHIPHTHTIHTHTHTHMHICIAKTDPLPCLRGWYLQQQGVGRLATKVKKWQRHRDRHLPNRACDPRAILPMHQWILLGWHERSHLRVLWAGKAIWKPRSSLSPPAVPICTLFLQLAIIP